MKLSEFNPEIYQDLVQQAKNCIDCEDVSGCWRVLLPIIEYYCAHYEPLPQIVVSMLMECSYIDEKMLSREQGTEPRMEGLTFSPPVAVELYC
jgi:hypothetical protein